MNMHWSYEDLIFISGTGTYFKWKEIFDHEYNKMADVDEEIQLINKNSLLEIEQVWTDKCKSIHELENRVVESLCNKALVLTHDENGHFGILCGYKALDSSRQNLREKNEIFGEKCKLCIFIKKICYRCKSS